MSEEKKNSPDLTSNVKSTTVVVDVLNLTDGTNIFVIRNSQGQPFKVCTTSAEVAQFFSELASYNSPINYQTANE